MKIVYQINNIYLGKYKSERIILRHGCFPVNLLHIFRTPFLKNTSGWLLLKVDNKMACNVQEENKKYSVTILQELLSNRIQVSMSNKMNVIKCLLKKDSTQKLILTNKSQPPLPPSSPSKKKKK